MSSALRSEFHTRLFAHTPVRANHSQVWLAMKKFGGRGAVSQVVE